MQMFDAGGYFFMATFHHRTDLRIAEIAACAFYDVACLRIGIAAFRALESAFGRIEVPFETALQAVIDRRIRSQIAYFVVGEIPDCFQRFRILLQVRVFAIMDKAA